MSEQSSKPLSSAQSASHWRDVLARRWPVYAALGAVFVLALAYIDAGEEPLRPITQPVALGGEG